MKLDSYVRLNKMIEVKIKYCLILIKFTKTNKMSNYLQCDNIITALLHLVAVCLQQNLRVIQELIMILC